MNVLTRKKLTLVNFETVGPSTATFYIPTFEFQFLSKEKVFSKRYRVYGNPNLSFQVNIMKMDNFHLDTNLIKAIVQVSLTKPKLILPNIVKHI